MRLKNRCVGLLLLLLFACVLSACLLLQAPLRASAESGNNLVYRLPKESFGLGGGNEYATRINKGTLDLMGDGVSADANCIQLNIDGGTLGTEKDVWFSVDLGAQYELRHLYLDSWNRNNKTWLLFDLYVSADGSEWTKLNETPFDEYENLNGYEGAALTDNRTGAPANHKIADIPLNCTGRYFRLDYVGFSAGTSDKSGYSIQIYEMELYGYSMESSSAAVEVTGGTVNVDAGTTAQSVLDGLSINGNGTVGYVDSEGASVDLSRPAEEGDRIVVQDNMKSSEAAAGAGKLGAASVQFADMYPVHVKKETVTVTFDGAEGTFEGGGSQVTRTPEAGSVLTDVPASPAREWYVFSHWAVKEGEAYREFDLTAPIAEDVTLYAQYEEATYTVTYIGYTATDGTASFGKDDNELRLPTVKEGKYVLFDGWYYDEEGTQPAAEGDELPAGNVTLYAKTESVTPLSQGKSVTLSENAETETGNVLANLVDGDGKTRWAANGTVQLISGGSDYANGPVELVVDLGAEYLIDSVTIAWVRGGNNDRTFYYELSVSADGETFGAPFAGYAEGEGEFAAETEHEASSAAEGRYLKLSVRGANQQTYLSVYELRVYGFALGESAEYSVDHATASVALLGDEPMTVQALKEKLAPVGNFKRTEYLPAQGSDGVNVADGDIYRIVTASDRTVDYRIARSRTVTFDFQDGVTSDYIVRVASGAKLSPPDAAAPVGKRLVGWRAEGESKNWNFAEDTVTEDVKLVAVWENIPYDIVYHVGEGDRGNNPLTYTVESEFVFAEGQREFYVFEGWFLSYDEETGEYSDRVTGIAAGSTGGVEVYAKFAPAEYEIVYNDLRGAEHDNLEKINVATDATLTPPTDAAGAMFDGWYLDALYAQPVGVLNGDLLSLLDGNGRLQLYAKWVKKYTVTFESNGGGTLEKIEYSEKSGSVTLPETVEREHYLFGGWYRDAALTQKVQTVDASEGRDLTVYAKWTPVDYTLHFFVNGGSAVQDVRAGYGSTFAAPAAPVREGYVFGGWFADAQCTQAYSFDSAVSGDVCVYAFWTKEETPEKTGCTATVALRSGAVLIGCVLSAAGAVVSVRKRKD